MIYYKRINTYRIKKNLLLFILVVAVVYLILPFWAGVFNYKITTGPKIYWQDYHFIIYCIGHNFSRQPYDRPTRGKAIFYHRPWFYFMPIKYNMELISKLNNVPKEIFNPECSIEDKGP